MTDAGGTASWRPAAGQRQATGRPPEPGWTAKPSGTAEPGWTAEPSGTAGPGRTAAPSGTAGPGRPAVPARPGLRGWLSRPLPRHLLLLAAYLAAGAVMIWPRPTYLAGRLPETTDQASYVWALWWVAHQLSHLGNPWFTAHLAAPAGVRLGFDTLMPLPGAVMAPVTLTFGPSVSYTLLTIVLPGLACYAMYRAARLWLTSETAAIATGGFYGLATMLTWQDWYHLNISAGALFLPLALETAVRLRRRPSWPRAVVAGLVLGASLLVNQESAIMAVILAACVLVPWLLTNPSVAKLRMTLLAAAAALLAASPQIIAMAQQLLAGGATVPPAIMARWDASFGTPPVSLFAPSPRLAAFGFPSVGTLFETLHPAEGVPTYGVVLTLLAVLGLVVGWNRRSARLLAALWAAATALALGPTLVLAHHRRLVPLPVVVHGVHMSLLLPYTWLVQIPGLSGFREADRFTLLGLAAAALLAGSAVDWLRRRTRPLLIVALALAALEAGYPGSPTVGTMPAAMPRLDGPIAADHSASIVVDVPFGLRGGVAPYGRPIPIRALVLATQDGHPRSDSYTSWVPASTVAAIRAHVFYRRLVAAEKGTASTPAQMLAARRDALAMRVGWALLWRDEGVAARYLRGVGFRFDYQVGGVRVYRLYPPTAAAASTGRG